MFGSDVAYDSFMGRYSMRLAPLFADFAGVEAGQHVLDVGAGTGALTGELVRRGARVAAAEPSSAFVEVLRRRFREADVQEAGAESLPWRDESFDAALAQLVVAFMNDPEAGVAEMRRVTRSGGTVAACMWDLEQMEMLAAVNATRRALGDAGERRRFMRPGEIELLFGADAELALLSVEADYADFDEFWNALLGGAGPAGAWAASLDDDQRAAAQRDLRRNLGEPDGPFTLVGRAWAVRTTRG
jgi:SAM-dependent methyltransferase